MNEESSESLTGDRSRGGGDGTHSGRSHAGRDVFQSIPRRPRIGGQLTTASRLSIPPKRAFSPSIYQVFVRLLLWCRRLLVFFLGLLWRRIRRRDSIDEDAKAFCRMLEHMGPTAIKVGQQLSVRADILPFQFCDELGKMLDRVDPFEFEHAVDTIEKAIGTKIEEVFERLDPVPIGSASLACVYQARLHEGDLVAVKVKRPGIGLRMTTDLKAIGFLCHFAEALGVVRPGLTKNLRLELNRMLTEELDFELESRYTEIFRREAKKNKYVTAPKVYPHLSNYDVLVTEFISGVFLSELLAAIESEDEASMKTLRARGFKRKKIARRMNQVFHWECFESYFFHADPHPANVIVKPDNTLVMIDFGSCGSVSGRMRRNLLAFNRNLVREDLNKMVDSTIAMLEPLPHFDVESFTIDMMNIYREIFIALKSEYSPWYEKCSGGMWMKVIKLGQKYNLPMTLDTVRIFRASFMYDSIIYRLHPRLDPQVEFKKYARRAERDTRRKMTRSVLRRLAGPLDSDFTKLHKDQQVMETALEKFERFLDEPRYNFNLTIGKVAYVFSTLMKTIVATAGIIGLLTVGRIVWGALSPTEVAPNLTEALAWTVDNRVFLVFLVIYLFTVLRKLLFRIDDVDVD